MGELVAFRPQSRAAAGPQSHVARQRDPGEGAEILFFTGVRFVRIEDYVEQAKTRRRRRDPRRRQPRRDSAPC
jgi:hypothetical protein